MLSREFRIQKSVDATKAETVDNTPHELTNIRVHEVSVVDHPANRRKFLITKRDKKGVKADSDVVVVSADEIADLSKAWKADGPGLSERDKAARDRLKKWFGKSQKSPEQEAEEAAEREAELKLTSKVDNPPSSEEPKKDEVPSTEAPTKEEPVVDLPAKDEPKVDEPKVEEPKADEPKADDADKTPAVAPGPEVKIEEKVTVKADEDVTKIGRPMQRARLDKLKAAWKVVTDILAELDVESDKAAPVAAAPAPAATVAAPVVVVPAPVVDTAKADANAAEIKRLTAMVETLQKMVKEQGAQLAKSQQPADSNTISLEKSKTDHDKVHWDPDMAASAARLRGRSF